MSPPVWGSPDFDTWPGAGAPDPGVHVGEPVRSHRVHAGGHLHAHRQGHGRQARGVSGEEFDIVRVWCIFFGCVSS